MLTIALWIAALVVFVLSTLAVPVPRINLQSLGLSLCVLAVLAQTWK